MAERDLHGPFVNLATLCHRAERGPDGLNIIGVIQKVTVTQTGGRPFARFPPVRYTCYAVVALQSGFALGTYPVRLELTAPAGGPQISWQGEVTFRGEEHGEMIIQQLSLVIGDQGLYWFDLLVGERLLSRFPFRVVYEPREAT